MQNERGIIGWTFWWYVAQGLEHWTFRTIRLSISKGASHGGFDKRYRRMRLWSRWQRRNKLTIYDEDMGLRVHVALRHNI